VLLFLFFRAKSFLLVKKFVYATNLTCFTLEIIVDSRSQQPVSFSCENDDEVPSCNPARPAIEIFGTLAVPVAIEHSLKAIRQGFDAGLEPYLSEEGTSGSYILKNSIGTPEEEDQEENLQSIAVWKPIDEEPFAPNNPRGMQAPFGSETCRPGVKSGESSLREVLAFLLDHEGFAGVPPTALVEVSHPSLKSDPMSENSVVSEEFRNLISGLLSFKRQQPITKNSNMLSSKSPDCSPKSINSTKSSPSTEDISQELMQMETKNIQKTGSLQLFVTSEGPIENFSPDLFSADEIHKIAVLDVRLLNLDRNACNILV